MIPAGASVFVATQPVDFRKGASGLVALVRDNGADPFSGALYVFRSKRTDRVKIVWWDGTGVCLFAKRLDSRPMESIENSKTRPASIRLRISMRIVGLPERIPACPGRRTVAAPREVASAASGVRVPLAIA
jgi:transposase